MEIRCLGGDAAKRPAGVGARLPEVGGEDIGSAGERGKGVVALDRSSCNGGTSQVPTPCGGVHGSRGDGLALAVKTLTGLLVTLLCLGLSRGVPAGVPALL